MNLPNKLTILRIIMTFVFMFLLYSDGFLSKIFAFVFFILACVTDFFDGYIARKYNLITDLGKILDPIADKILVLAALLSFVHLDLIPAWMVLVIILRELLITSIRMMGLKKGKVLAASAIGKHKTFSQMMSIFYILIVIIIKETSNPALYKWQAENQLFLNFSVYLVMLFTVGLTIISGVFYLIRNRRIFGA